MRPFLIAAVLVLLVTGCGSPEAVVQELSPRGAHPLPIQLRSVQGGRDGYATTVTVKLDDGPGTWMNVELRLNVDPQATLEEGVWSYEGPTGRAEGEVRALELRFVGGQGEGASVGGRFELREAGQPRFLLSLPLSPLRSPEYTPDS